MCTRSAPPGPQDSRHAERAVFERVMGSRRSWRRLAKRATAAHQRDLAELARRVAAPAPPVLLATSRPLRGEASAAVARLTLTLPGWELELSGVAAVAASGVAAAAGDAVRLTRTGRYGSFWWIELSSYGDMLVLLGSQLRLSPTGDGPGQVAAHTPPVDVTAGTG